MKRFISIFLAVLIIVSTAAISGMVSAETVSIPADAASHKEITLIDPYAEKSADDMYQIAPNGVEGLSVVNADTLAVSGDDSENLPTTTAYLVNQESAVTKTGGMVRVGGENGIDVSGIMTEFLAGKVYLDAWLYVEDPAAFTVPVFRLFERYEAAAGNYIEFHVANGGYANISGVSKKAGWNHVVFALSPSSTGNYITTAMSNFTAEGIIRYVAFYNHQTGTSNCAVGAVKLSTDPSKDDWDVSVSGKTLYRVGDEFLKNDITVTYKGEKTENFTVSTPDMTTAGKKIVVVTLNGKKYNHQIDVTPKGIALGASSHEVINVGNAGKNVDNYLIGNQSIQHSGAAVSQANSVFAPQDFRGTDYIKVNLYFSKAVLDDTSSGWTYTMELGSNGHYNNMCVRYVIDKNSVAPMGLVPGWNEVCIPVGAKLVGNAFTNYRLTSGKSNGLIVVWNHDTSTNTKKWVDWTNVNYFRFYSYKIPAVVLMNGFGYGFDTEINGVYAGDDFNESFAAVNHGETLKINKSIALNGALTVSNGKSVKIDLNGYNITSDSSEAFYVDGGRLEIVDNNKKLFYSNAVKYGKISGKDTAVTVAGENAIVNLGANVKTEANIGVSVAGNANVKLQNTMNGTTGVHVAEGAEANIEISGGEYNLVDVIKADGKTSVAITDGVFNGNVISGESNVTVTGGKYLNSSIEQYLGEKYVLTQKNDYYVVEKVSVVFNESEVPGVYSGNWHKVRVNKAMKKDLLRASASRSTASFAFNGSIFKIIGYKSPTYGKFAISIDGGEETVVDLYNETAVYQEIIYETELAEGLHEVKIRVLKEKNAAASCKGLFYVAFDGFVTNGEFVDISTDLEVIEKQLRNNMNIVIDETFNPVLSKKPLTAEAQNGTVTVSDNVISYTAGENVTYDMINYSVNGFTGIIKLTREELIIEAEKLFAEQASRVFNLSEMHGRKGLAFAANTDIEFNFAGSTLDIIGYRSKTYGQFEVYIDGKLIDTVNEYIPSGMEYQKVVGSYELDKGTHAVRIHALDKILIDALCVTPFETRVTLTDEELYDKVLGSWAGQMTGVAWGYPTEFRSNGQIMPESMVPAWTPNMINNAFTQDDLYTEVPFIDAMTANGIEADLDTLGAAFANTTFWLDHANGQARRNLQSGISAGASGHYLNSYHADDIDWQIEADFLGNIYVGKVSDAAQRAFEIGHIMNYGDGVYGGVYVTAMHSAAFTAKSIGEICEAGRKAIPENTKFRSLIDDIHKSYENGETWQQCWQMLEDKWTRTDKCVKYASSVTSIDAKLNSGYILIGLLWGEGDLEKTMEISMRCGQDSDCNPSSAAGILGGFYGYSQMDTKFVGALDITGTKFNTTDYTLKNCIDMNINLMNEYLGKSGCVKTDNGWVIKREKNVTPVAYEQWPDDEPVIYLELSALPEGKISFNVPYVLPVGYTKEDATVTIDMGDGNVIPNNYAGYQYNSAGTYTVTAIIEVAGKIATASKTIDITTGVGGSGFTKTASVSVTQPNGAGSKDISVIVDGVIPTPGSAAAADRVKAYDTFCRGVAIPESIWYAVNFDHKVTVTDVLVSDGIHFGNGGYWASTPQIQVLVNGEWVNVNTTVSPEFAGASAVNFTTYTYTLETPVKCEGVKVVGKGGGSAGFTSVSEIDVKFSDVENPTYVYDPNPIKTAFLITSQPAPLGGGNKNLEIIRDGIIPKNASDPAAEYQYDTYIRSDADVVDYFGYIFRNKVEVRAITYVEGAHFNNGGWFKDGTMHIEALINGEWQTVNASVSPEYPDSDNRAGHSPNYTSFTFTLSEAVVCDGFRVIGTSGGEAHFVGVSELSADCNYVG